MTLTDMIKLISSRLGKRTGLVESIQNEIVMAQAKLESGIVLPWFRIQVSSTVTWTTATSVYALPTGFLRPVEDIPAVWRDDPTATALYRIRPLTTKPFLELAADDTTDEPGTPLFYAMTGGTYNIWPIPDKTYTAKLIAYFADVVLVSGSVETNSWTAHCPDMLIAEAGYQMGHTLRDQVAIRVFEAERAEARERLWKSDAASRSSSFEMIMVD